MGTRKNCLNEAILMCTHNLCFEQKYENSKNNSTRNCHFYSCEKSLYVAWACFRYAGHSGLYIQFPLPKEAPYVIWL